MIQPLRTRHRHVVVVLAIVLPLLFAAGLIVRDQPPLHLSVTAVRGAR